MRPLSRRSIFGLLAAGAAATVAPVWWFAQSDGDVRGVDRRPRTTNPIPTENKHLGTAPWRAGGRGTRDADNMSMQISGYASATSVNVGESIDFHVTVNPPGPYVVEIYRLGYYDGVGARRVAVSETLAGVRQPPPNSDPGTGVAACDWPAGWSLRVPADWISGAYVAVFVSTAGWRAFTPFVVRDDRRAAELCVVLPFTTYQAYNVWPQDGRTGRSLYRGYGTPGGEVVPGRGSTSESRAVAVSFDRPYAGAGLPSQFDDDHDFVMWVEQAGFDVTYATSLDLHTGRIDPSRFDGLIFCGHDEYWSQSMRLVAQRAIDVGTSLAFLGANSMYWRIRYEPSADNRADRIMVCYRTRDDPEERTSGPTVRWRDLRDGGLDAEQRLLGVQYNGIIDGAAPLIVRAADHWFWAGCSVRDGDTIPGVVGGEADGVDTRYPAPTGGRQVLLSASPYTSIYGGSAVQNTSLYETPQGATVFASGTLAWTMALGRPGHRDDRIRTATANLLNRITGRRFG